MTVQESELGFGTEYEKIIFSEIIGHIGTKYGITSYYNYPKNNLLGQTQVITGSLAETAKSPDLLWNFCEFENRKDSKSFLSEIESFNPRHVLIVTQNRLNPGTLLHYFYHKIFGKEWDHGYLSKMTINPIKQYSTTKASYEILEIGTFDAPWFILDVYEVGRYLKKLIPKTKQSTSNMKSSIFESSPGIIRNWASHHNYILLRFNSSLNSREIS